MCLYDNTRFDPTGDPFSTPPRTTSPPTKDIVPSQHDSKKRQHAAVQTPPLSPVRLEAPRRASFGQARLPSSTLSMHSGLNPMSHAATHGSGGSGGNPAASFGRAATLHTILDGPSLKLSANQLITYARHDVSGSRRQSTEVGQGWKGASSTTGAHLGTFKSGGGLVTCCVPGGHRGACSSVLKMHR